jgi:hypothetical protein
MAVKFKQMEHERRLEWLGSKIIGTPDVQKVTRLCDRLYRQARTKNEGNGGFVLGDTGTGKSTAVAAFANNLAKKLATARPDSEWLRPKVVDTPIRPIFEVVSETGWLRHVVVIVVPPRPRFNSFLRSTAAALGVKLNSRFDFGEALDQIKEQIDHQKVKMMIFDEVQHFVEGTVDSYQAADVIKIIMKCRVQVICVGMPHMLNLVEGENANDQLLRLKQKQVEVKGLNCSLNDFIASDGSVRAAEGDVKFADTDFTNFCRALDDRSNLEAIVLPFDASSDISNAYTAIRLWRAGKGYVGKMMEILFQASDLAIEKRLDRLTPRVLAAALRDNGVNDKDNWFMMEVPVMLQKISQPKPEADADAAAGTGKRRRSTKNPLSRKH